MKRFLSLVLVLALILALAGCGAGTAAPTQPETTPAPSAEPTEDSLESTASTVTSEPVQTGLFAEQIFSGADGDIHYSYYLPDSYAGSRKFPMMVVMPGYNMMWFGEDSSGSNLNWNGFTAWTRLDTEMVVVSAQLTDWGEKSARQAIELTEYFINRFAVDTSRIYAAGYSAGGETMSRAVSMRPDLYAAYLHGASQWDGSYLFTQIKMAVSVKEAAEYYGLEVNRGNMVCCPFHADRTPSMKLNEDYFYCFGCGAHGDVIDLVVKLFNLSSYDAAKKLAYDFGIDPDKPPAAAALRKPKYPLAKAFQNETLHCQRILCDYLHLLAHWKVQYAPKTPDDTLDDHFVKACQMLDYIEDLTDILTFAELEVRVKTVDMLQKDGMIDRLEERLKRTEKEVDARDETEIG